ncbi:MAG: hypothetical protein LBI64_03280 [Coriobacteriales bacterium]|nr:hypothetical protein [Coriobacteriales bacterium]
MPKGLVRFIFAMTLILVAITLISCNSKTGDDLAEVPTEAPTPPDGGTDGAIGRDEGTPSTGGSASDGALSFEELVAAHELPLAGNPIAGSYITTSGIDMRLGEDGSYRWDEGVMDGPLLTGSYTVSAGTMQQMPTGEMDYVFESQTGPVYTVIIEFDAESAQATGAVSGTIQVFDAYSDTVFRVTDLRNYVQFEATRV